MKLIYRDDIAPPGGLKYIAIRQDKVTVGTKDGRKLIYKSVEVVNEKSWNHYPLIKITPILNS